MIKLNKSIKVNSVIDIKCEFSSFEGTGKIEMQIHRLLLFNPIFSQFFKSTKFNDYNLFI